LNQTNQLNKSLSLSLSLSHCFSFKAGGIEGNYRFTCENVMRVLRANKESLMAVLEAFVHDPLINWRLLNTGNQLSEETDDDNKHESAPSLEEAIHTSGSRTQRPKGYVANVMADC